MTGPQQIASGEERFTVDDLEALSVLVAATWSAAAGRDWSVPAGELEWSCLATADHAVDCVYAPAFFLASRRVDDYPRAGDDLTLGARRARGTPSAKARTRWTTRIRPRARSSRRSVTSPATRT